MTKQYNPNEALNQQAADFNIENVSPLSARTEPANDNATPEDIESSHGDKTASNDDSQPHYGFINTENGLYYVDDSGKKRIGDKLLIDGIGELDGVGYIFVSFIDKLGHPKNLPIPMSDIAKTDLLIGYLTGSMYQLNFKHKGLYPHYLNNSKAKLTVKPVKQLGWYGDSYVMPDKIMGANAENLKYYGYADVENFTTKGTLEQWRENVATPCIGRNGLELALYTSLAGVIVHEHSEGIGINAHGDSGTGKTKAGGYVLMSVWGSPIERYNDAANPKGGFEGLCYEHNHQTLFIDELTNAQGSHLKAIPYMAVNGCAPSRGKPNPSMGKGYNKGRKWRICLYTTSELALDDILKEFNLSARAGEEFRLLSITGLKYCGDDEQGFYRLSNSAQQYYGTAAPALIEWIIKTKPDIKQLISDEFNRLVAVGDVHNTQTKRIARAFSVLIVAGELAKKAGVIPSNADPRKTLTNIYYTRWHCFNISNLETMNILRCILNEIEVKDTFIEDEETTTKYGAVYGVWHTDLGKTEPAKYFVFSSGLCAMFKKKRCDNEVNKLRLIKVIPHELAKTRRLKYKSGAVVKGYELDHDLIVELVEEAGA